MNRNYLGLGLIVFLGCQGMHSTQDQPQASHPSSAKHKLWQAHDSAPSGPVPKTFKLVKPVNEPLSRYGNPATYRVDGHEYQVLTKARGYRRQGLASWYGTKFHARRTSSGDDYDMYALTAAHKTLPLPTYVRVKNLDNGRAAIVKVNDRGPFHTGRIIDLSYGAAVKLGIFPKGTARVEIEALTPTGKGQQHAAQYYIQAGAFLSQQSADQFRRKVAQAAAAPVFVTQDKKQYLVRLGPFKDKNRMEQLKQSLSHKGIKGSFSLLL